MVLQTAPDTTTRLNTEDLDGTIFVSDNLPFLKALDTESIDLVCIDPPFGKQQTFKGDLKPPLEMKELNDEQRLLDDWGVYDPATAYEMGVEWPDQTGRTANFADIWDFPKRVEKDWYQGLEYTNPSLYMLIESTRYSRNDGTAAYIAFMAERMIEIRRVLKPTGSVYLHCDHDANAYLRQMMDTIFSDSNFLNEVIWYYRGAGIPKKAYARRHDTLLWYAKEAGLHYFNPDPIRQEYAKATTERFQHHIGNVRGGRDYGVQKLNPKGKHPDDVITNIQPIAPSAKERTGYPTQKPQALARRIIEASSNPNDIVLDCFAGCAYVPVAAQITGRRWIACDMSPRAWTVIRRQFHKHPDLGIITEGELSGSVEARFENVDKVIKVRGPGELPVRTTPEVKQKPIMKSLPRPQFKQKAIESSAQIWQAFVEQWGTACWYCGTERAADRRELHLDHIVPNKGDGTNDDCFNRAIACAPCNSDKGNNLDVHATLEKAFEDGRIQTAARRNEIERGFKERHEWAKIRWTRIKPNMVDV